MSARPVEDWFHNAVVSGVQRLYALNLPDRPAAEVVQLTAVTWVDVLWALLPWAEHLDAWRLPVAFTGLAASADRWPAPTRLRAHLPARKMDAPTLSHSGQLPPAHIKAALAATRMELQGIDRRHKRRPASGNIGAGDQAATDAADQGTE
jgi:hypothetical protein